MSGLDEFTADEQEVSPGDEAAEAVEAVEAVEAAEGEDDVLNIGQERVLELISYLVVNLVEHPDDVTVDIVRRQDRDVYQVRVNEADLGKVIGKGGQTAQAMRVLLTAVSANTDQRIGLEIVE
jgi:predicted RNA-binding protein YlqC (UPF0109 family)